MDVWTDPRRRRWIGWAVLAASFVVFSFHRVSTSVIADELMRAFDTTGTELGVLHSSLFYIYALLQVPAGVLADRLGTRRIATAGTLLMGVGVLGFAASDGYLVAFLARATIGLGGSVIYISALRYCANWYRADEFATMTGITSAMPGIGGILATTPLAVAVAELGWRATLGAVGVVGLLAGLGIYVGVRDTPGDAGLPAIEGVDPPSETSFRAAATNARLVLGDPTTWVLGVVFLAFVGTTFTVLGIWGVPFLVDRYGITVRRASTYVLVGNLGFLFGPPAMGRLSDRLGVRAPIVAAASVCFAAGYGFVAVVGRPPLLLVGALLFAVTFVGGAGFITFTLVKERHPAAASGSATGAVNSLGFAGVAALPVVMGWLLDAFWTGEVVDGARVYTALGYRAAFAVAAAMGLVALAGSTWYWWAADGTD
ncbi:MFS transporter [Haloplanus salilacus]|uniref:MFS transporter n=1 Tax=Haloplanus salilacus TaxID=2949994 RepID=UPI0030CD94D6